MLHDLGWLVVLRLEASPTEKKERKLLAFADNTVAVSKVLNLKNDERQSIQHMAECQEFVHPGKTEILAARVKNCEWYEGLEEDEKLTFLDAARVLGVRIDADGGSAKDNKERLRRARILWLTVKAQ